MNVDVMEQPEACQQPRVESGTWIAARIRQLMQRFPSASQGLLSIFDQAVVSGTGFTTAVIIGRMTSRDELGLYYVVLSLVLICSGIQEQVIAAPYIVYSKRRRGRELAEYYGSTWWHHFVLTVVVLAVLMAAIPALTLIGRTDIVPGIWALLGAGPLWLLRDAIRRFNYAHLHVRSAIVLDVIVAVVQLGGLALLGYFGMLSLFAIYAMMGAACGIASVGWYLSAPPRVRLNRTRLMSDWRNNWAFGKWAVRTFLLGNTTPYIMVWLLALSVGAAATGVLGACTTLIGITNILLSGVANVLTPQAAHAYASGGAGDLRRVLGRTAVFLALALGSLVLLVTLTGDRLAVFVFGAQYQGTGPILIALAFAALLNSIGMVVGNGLWAIDQPRANFLADVCCISVTLAVAAALVFPLGALGAALASLAGAFVAAVVRTFTLIRYLDRDVVASANAVHPAVST